MESYLYCNNGVWNLDENICKRILRRFKRKLSVEGPGEGGYSQKNWVGVCGLLPKTLTLFMTKIWDIPYPIYDLTKKFETLFMTSG